MLVTEQPSNLSGPVVVIYIKPLARGSPADGAPPVVGLHQCVELLNGDPESVPKPCRQIPFRVRQVPRSCPRDLLRLALRVFFRRHPLAASLAHRGSSVLAVLVPVKLLGVFGFPALRASYKVCHAEKVIMSVLMAQGIPCDAREERSMGEGSCRLREGREGRARPSARAEPAKRMGRWWNCHVS